MTPPSRRSLVALLLATLVAAACQSQPTVTPSPTPAPTATPTPAAASPTASLAPADVYRLVNEQVRAIRGLEEEQPVEPQLVTRDELAEVIRASFDEDYPPDKRAADEALYHALGLLDPDVRLDDVYLELLETQVAGLYDPVSDGLYVLTKEGGVGPVERVYYAHEYDHALQDQRFDLVALFDLPETNGDRLLARQALVEGDAYVLMTYWLQQHLAPAELAEVIQASGDPEALEALERIPPIVKAQLLFAATQGTQFVLAEQLEGGWAAVDAAYDDLPVSTEQILDPAKWAAREAPIAVELPGDLAAGMGAGWTVRMEDTLGQYQTSVWLGDETGAAAAGWGGDRIALLEGPDDAWALGWQTVWDSASAATRFATAADEAVAGAGGPGEVLPGEGGATRWVVLGSDAASLGRIAGALGLAG